MASDLTAMLDSELIWMAFDKTPLIGIAPMAFYTRNGHLALHNVRSRPAL